MAFNPNNFTKQNTPRWAQVSGDVAFIIGLLGLAIIKLPSLLTLGLSEAESDTIIKTIPQIIFTFGGWCAAIGFIYKFITKMIGNGNNGGDGTASNLDMTVEKPQDK